jgi:hypothetical protein
MMVERHYTILDDEDLRHHNLLARDNFPRDLVVQDFLLHILPGKKLHKSSSVNPNESSYSTKDSGVRIQEKTTSGLPEPFPPGTES